MEAPRVSETCSVGTLTCKKSPLAFRHLDLAGGQKSLGFSGLFPLENTNFRCTKRFLTRGLGCIQVLLFNDTAFWVSKRYIFAPRTGAGADNLAFRHFGDVFCKNPPLLIDIWQQGGCKSSNWNLIELLLHKNELQVLTRTNNHRIIVHQTFSFACWERVLGIPSKSETPRSGIYL